MIPILYESDETLFALNGLGRLRDCISCVVTEERNGIYECDFEYPVDGQNYELIQLGRIIAVEHDDTDDVQPFDIVSYSKPIDGIVQFHAVHISYRLSKIVANGSNITSLSSAFSMLRNGTPPNPFMFETGKTSTGYMASADGIPKSIRSFLGGIEGSILDAYGGEYEWDGFTVRLHEHRGEMKDFTVRYGVDLVDYNEEMDYSESFTAVIPYWTSDEATVIGAKQSVSSPSYNGREECVAFDVSDKFEEQPTQAQIENCASSFINSNNVNLPAQTITVDFVRLTEDDTPLSYLYKCKLCDMIQVEFPRYGMSGRFKIVKTVYNVLLERFDEMELGTLSVSLAEALGITGDSALKESSVADYVVEQGTSGIWWYRKWNSGIAECWGVWSGTLTNYTSTMGGNAYYTTISFPTGLFNAAPVPQYTSSIGGNFALTGTLAASLTKDSCNYYALSNSTGSKASSFYIYAIGTWR